MKKLILILFAGFLFWGCYTQIGTVREDEGYSTAETRKESRIYNESYNHGSWFYHKYVYRYYLPYPRYYLFFKYYTPGFGIGWSEWWYYDPYWFDYYCWDWDWYWWNRYCSFYWYLPAWYYYPWWYRAPIIVIINNYPPYSDRSDRSVVYRPRNFGSTREGARDERVRSESGSQTVSPPSRSIPRSSSEGIRTSSDDGSMRKPSGSGREVPRVEERGGRERPREIGATRTPQNPRVVPRSNSNGDESAAPSQDSAPPQRTNPPRRSGSTRNLIQIDRDNSGRSTLIEVPRQSRVNNPSSVLQGGFVGSSSDDRRGEQKRQIGNRR
ncbi:MAG: hypothetical protein N2252_05615 [Candidatus Kryptonium sp.]|nr:hypothetical protein [Candidatus Kryptonium sp.]